MNSLICKIKGHKADKKETTCPFTLKTYQVCVRCGIKRVKPE